MFNPGILIPFAKAADVVILKVILDGSPFLITFSNCGMLYKSHLIL